MFQLITMCKKLEHSLYSDFQHDSLIISNAKRTLILYINYTTTFYIISVGHTKIRVLVIV